jgi:hypothetical protein
MSHLLNMPTVLKASMIKGQWRLAGDEDGIPLVEQHTFYSDMPGNGEVRPHPSDGKPYYFHFTEEESQQHMAAAIHNFADPWELLREFTGLRTSSALMTFLNSTGHFCDPLPEFYGSFDDSELIYGTTDFWQLQELFVEMLLKRRPLPDISKVSIPHRWREAFEEGFTFLVRRRLGEYVAEVETYGTLSTLIAVAQLKILQGERFRICKRSDCGKVFQVETRGRRTNQYCGHACAHTAWQRRDRKTKVQIIDEREQFGYGVYRSARKGR